jgi:O-methyltransferase
MFSLLRNYVGRRRCAAARAATFERFSEFTMIPRETYLANLDLASQAREIPGCVVECGVWRGGMSAGMASVLGPDRKYFLFDSFEGLPPAQAVDGPAAIAWQSNPSGLRYYDNCSAPPDAARRAMQLGGAKSFELVKGWFNATIPNFALPEPIALLRLDGDWYESTMTCLEHLFPKVAPQGIIILDDYYSWDGCSRALHDYLSKTQATERIASFHGGCFLRKADAPKTTP